MFRLPPEVYGLVDEREATLGPETLPEERAEAVKGYLVGRGLDPHRVRIEAPGAAVHEASGVSVRLLAPAPQKPFRPR